MPVQTLLEMVESLIVVVKEAGVDLENLKLLIFGTTVKPDAAQAPLLKVIFWPDVFLFSSFLFSILLVVVISLFFSKGYISQDQGKRGRFVGRLFCQVRLFLCLGWCCIRDFEDVLFHFWRKHRE